MVPKRITEAFSVPWQRTLYIMFIAQIFTSIGFSVIFPFLPLYIKSLDSTMGFSVEFLAGLVFSVQGFMMMLASPIWGVLADRFGRKLMVERALFGGAIILLLMAFVTSAEQLLVLRALQGAITGTVGAANALIASVVPRKRAGYAMGLYQFGIWSGVAVGPILGGLIADAFGYAAAFYVTAGMLFTAGMLVYFGVQAEGVKNDDKTKARKSFLQEWKDVLSSTGVMLTFLLRFFAQLGRMLVFPFVPLFLEMLLQGTAHLNTFTGLVTTIGSAAASLSTLLLGRLGDRVGYRLIVIICTLSAAIFFVLQSFSTSGWQLLILQGLIGITIGGLFPSISALLANYTKHGEEGAVYGLDNSITAGARAVAPMLGSTVVMLFTLRSTFLATALLFTITAAIALFFLPKRNAVTAEQSK
jgi:DHA1 family multidrug resistance protein-like MFS transporter